MILNEDYITEQDGDIVISAYQELLSEKAAGDEFCWGYYLRIENNSQNRISLIGKDISVTDMNGRSVSVYSDGFKGELPELDPGEVYEFEDYATSKSSAVLCGSCKIANENNREIKNVRLPVLSLIANDNAQRILN